MEVLLCAETRLCLLESASLQPCRLQTIPDAFGRDEGCHEITKDLHNSDVRGGHVDLGDCLCRRKRNGGNAEGYDGQWESVARRKVHGYVGRQRARRGIEVPQRQERGRNGASAVSKSENRGRRRNCDQKRQRRRGVDADSSGGEEIHFEYRRRTSADCGKQRKIAVARKMGAREPEGSRFFGSGREEFRFVCK